MIRRLARTVAATAALSGALLVAPQVAHADAAGPTDYRSEVTAITPRTEAIDVSIVGGDAFVLIVVAPGHEVIVLGYDSEPYLRIDADGTVAENRRSEATYYNAERFGNDEIPEFADNDAAPEWHEIGHDGRWAWHDHRAHWMGSAPPIGLDPGESLPAQSVRLLVDGRPVEVSVQTTLQASPPPWPAILGVLIGLGLAVFGAAAGTASRVLATSLIAVAATFVGIAQFRSLPSETGPLLTWWLLPAMALACMIVTILTYGRSVLLHNALTALAGMQLSIWAFGRRSSLTKAVLPTDLPFWLDRVVTGAALAGGVTLTVLAIWELLRPPAPVPATN